MAPEKGAFGTTEARGSSTRVLQLYMYHVCQMASLPCSESDDERTYRASGQGQHRVTVRIPTFPSGRPRAIRFHLFQAYLERTSNLLMTS